MVCRTTHVTRRRFLWHPAGRRQSATDPGLLEFACGPENAESTLVTRTRLPRNPVRQQYSLHYDAVLEILEYSNQQDCP